MTIILIFLLTIFVIIGSKNHPFFIFWLLINFYFDPGGYQLGLFRNNIISNINFTDIIFLLCWIPYFNVKKDFSANEEKLFKQFYKYMSIYMLYFVIVYGFIMPQISGRSNFITFFIKSRSYLMAFLLIRPIYFFVKFGLKINFRIILYLAGICLTLYLVSLISGLNLIPVATVDRYNYAGSGIMRITLWSYGLFDWILNFSIIVMLLKIRIRNKKLLFYSGLLMAFSIVLTLTRRELIGRIYSILIIIFLVNYFFRSHIRIHIGKILIPFIILLVLLYFTFPQYIGYASDEYRSIGSLITSGKDKIGGEDYRLAGTGDVISMKKLISENLLFGVGFTYYTSDDFTDFRNNNNILAGLRAGGELPYLGSLGKMGIVGLILFLPVYFLILKVSFKIIKIARNIDINLYIKNYPYEAVFTIFALAFIISKFTFNLFNLFVESYDPTSLLVLSIIFSILIAAYNSLIPKQELAEI